MHWHGSSVPDPDISICEARSWNVARKHMTWWKNEEIKSEFYMYDVEHPKFSEKLLEFLSFWEQFTGGIHNNTEIADVTKFTYLRSLLEGGKFGGSSLYARTLICAWCSTKLAIVAIIEWSAFRSMFALEAAQAGFPDVFKSLELNTFGGLYTK
ncbi:hypothetical protein T02_6803 [Trichinella nativa]|uniref:Uncharacterized protein n=1 Tax=Trichinella nativa TaxID=6335 RepID=A0A0V1KQJ7_9BILA|nr:hypothetical protein T02_6803 [Trichinella nativa]